MTDKELKTIKTIAELGSIQKAAVQLQKNPSSISRMVHRVEEDLVSCYLPERRRD